MPLVLTPARKDQLPDFVNIFLDAFTENPQGQAMRPQGVTPKVLEHAVQRNYKDFDQQRCAHFMIVVDTDLPPGQDIVCVSKWLYQDEQTHVEEDQKAKDNAAPEHPEGINEEAKNEFTSLLGKRRREVMRQTPYWHLQLLATKKAHRGRGAAGMALGWGIQCADRDGVEVFINSTPAGLPFYKAHGFTVEFDDEFHLQKYGVDAVNHNYAMLRKRRRGE